MEGNQNGATDSFKAWVEELLRSREEGRDHLNSYDLPAEAAAMGYHIYHTMYEHFAGPFHRGPLHIQDIHWEPPPEYRVSSAAGLGPLNLQRYRDDVLFYIFYTFVSETMQIMAADELYSRGWRYHKQRCVWLRECSKRWWMFEPSSWQISESLLDVDPSALEGRPSPAEPYKVPPPDSVETSCCVSWSRCAERRLAA